MTLAVWSTEPAQRLAEALPDQDRSLVRIGLPYECARWLAEGEVDLALVSTLDVLKNPSRFAAVPGTVYASEGSCVYARLVLKKPLVEVESLAIDPRYPLETVMAQVLLHEHYGLKPALVAPSSPEAAARQDALLLAGTTQPASDGMTVLDLGSEWFELTTRPMTWGFFATRAGEQPPEYALELKEAIEAATASIKEDAASPASRWSEPARAFVQEHLVTGSGAYVLAGLDELANYLFYRNLIDDLPEIPFASLPEKP